MYFPDFYCKNGKTTDLSTQMNSNTLEFDEKESTSLLQIINWMYTGKLHLHNQTLYTIMKLSKKFQIQVLVSKIKKIDEENITLGTYYRTIITRNVSPKRLFYSFRRFMFVEIRQKPIYLQQKLIRMLNVNMKLQNVKVLQPISHR